jgi:hypothetical protein
MKVLVDAELGDRLRDVHEPVELRDGSGQTYGYFHPAVAPPSEPRQSPRSPFSDEELARRQSISGGRPLAEIWQDLASR